MIVYVDSSKATRAEVLQSYLDHGFSHEEAEVYTSILKGDEAGNPVNIGQID